MSDITPDVETGSGSRGPAPEPPVEDSRGVEAGRERRLLKLFAEQVREHGRERVAEMLEIDPRTVSATLKRGVLSRRVRIALERQMGTEPGGRQDEPDVARRLDAVEREAAGLREATVAGFKALRDGQARGLEPLEGRIARVEARLDAWEEGEASGPEGEPVVEGSPSQVRAQKTGHAQATRPEPRRQPEPKAKRRLPPREHPELVTEDPAPDDAAVYGEAWPLVEEWRQLWKAHVRAGRGLEWLRREERVLELEIAMLEEHRLTLPPATFPQRGVWRHGQVSWRWKALQDAQRARARGEVRRWAGRVLTSGLLLGLTALLVLIERSSTPG